MKKTIIKKSTLRQLIKEEIQNLNEANIVKRKMILKEVRKKWEDTIVVVYDYKPPFDFDGKDSNLHGLLENVKKIESKIKKATKAKKVFDSFNDHFGYGDMGEKAYFDIVDSPYDEKEIKSNLKKLKLTAKMS